MLKTQALTAQAQGLIGTISSYMTLLNNYPKNSTVADLLASLGIKLNTTFDFLDGVLNTIGVNEDKMKAWFADIVTPEWLEVIGENIKYILLLQLKSVFTCSTNPFIPDNLMEIYESSPGTWTKGDGVLVDIDEIDLFGTLDLSPNSKQGFSYYFDNGEMETGITVPSDTDYAEATELLSALPEKKNLLKNEKESLEVAKKTYKATKDEEQKKRLEALIKEHQFQIKEIQQTIDETTKNKKKLEKTIEDFDYNRENKDTDKPKKGTPYYKYPDPVVFEHPELYKSRDFNAFLWYLIHESSRINLEERRKCIWDDRNKKYKVPKSSKTGQDAANLAVGAYDVRFLSDNLSGNYAHEYSHYLYIDADKNDTGYIIKDPKGKEAQIIPNSFLNSHTDKYSPWDSRNFAPRKEYFILESVKDGGKQLLRMSLNPQRYYRTYAMTLPFPSVSTGPNELQTNPTKKHLTKYEDSEAKRTIIDDIGRAANAVTDTINDIDFNGSITVGFNKTLFEFDYDYISSIKIYDSKVLLSSIMRALANLSIDASLSLKTSESKEMIRGIVQNIVTDVMNEQEIVDIGEYFTFTNEQYDEMLRSSQSNIQANFSGNTEDELVFALSQAGNGSLSTSQQQSAVTYAITMATSATTAAQNGMAGEERYLFADGGIFKYIIEMLKTTVTELIMSVLSPKVAMIYAVNCYIAGDFEGKWSLSGFIKSMKNLITSIAKMILKMILDELYAFVFETLQLLVEKIMVELTMERIMFYIRQLKALKALLKQAGNMIKNLPLLSKILSAVGGTNGNQHFLASIDDVNYADIIPKQTEPN